MRSAHCGDMATKDGMDWHIEEEGLQCQIKCTLCDWRGLRLHLDEHLGSCPRKDVTCDHCYEAMEQCKMLSHECAFHAEVAECKACGAQWSNSRVSSAFLRESDSDLCARSCPHVCLCQSCAVVWKDTSPNQGCHYCRTPFQSTMALADWLWKLILLEPPEPDPDKLPSPPVDPTPPP